MTRTLAALAVLCLAGPAAQAAIGQSGAGETAAPPPPAGSADQERYEAELRRYQAEQERYRQGVREAEEARRRYEEEQGRYQRRLERVRRQQEERGMRVARPPERQGSDAPAGAPAPPAASPTPATAGSGGTSTWTVPAPASPDAPADPSSPPPAAPAATASATTAASPAAADVPEAVGRCEQQERRNRRRGRRAGGVVGFIARTFNPIGGVAGLVTAVVPVGELLGEAIAGLLDCDEQQRAANATEEAVRGGVGTTASWTSETRAGVGGSSTVIALEPEPGGGACMTVTDVVILDGEETRAPKRLCRRPPSSRFVRV